MVLSGVNGTRIVLVVGAGVAIGVCCTVIIRRINSLIRKVDQLQAEIKQLKIAITEKDKNKTTHNPVTAGYYSIHGSSGEEEEEDEEFEEAVEGTESEQRLKYQVTFEQEAGSRFVTSDVNGVSDPPERLFEKVDRLLDGLDGDKQKAYSLLHGSYNQYSKNVDFLWRYAKAMYNVALINGSHGNEESKKDLTFKALQTVTDALDVDDENANAHKWFAITIGSTGDYLSTQDKIQNGYKFKEHIEKAIALSPEDPSSHYLLGRWCYGVYMLSWVERKVAATLFATPPTATAEDALKHFLKAQTLQGNDWKENLLFIAKCHIAKSNYKAAVEWLDKANSIPTVSVDDKEAQAEVDNLLYKYGGYR